MTDIKNANISITANNQQAIQQTVKLEQSITNLHNEVNKTKIVVKDANSSWATFSQGLYSVIGNVKEFANATKSSLAYLREGADLAEAQKNFEAYTASIGISAENLMRRIRKATNNQVSDLNLMKSATNALRVAGIKDIDALEKLYQIADAKGDLLGLSLEETFNKIVNAITSGNGKALIELGMLPDSFTKASNSADLLKNRTEVLNEVIRKGTEDIASLNSVGETTSDKFNQLDAAFTNLNSELKICLSEFATPLITLMRDEGIPVLQDSLDLVKDYFSWVQKGNFSGAFDGKKLGQLGIAESKRIEIENLTKTKNQYQQDYNNVKNSWWLSDYNAQRISQNYGSRVTNKDEALEAIQFQIDQIDKQIEKANKDLNNFKENAKEEIKIEQKQAEEAEKTRIEKEKEAEEAEKRRKAEEKAKKLAEEAKKAEEERLKIAKERDALSQKLLNQYGNLANSIMPKFNGTEKEAYEVALNFAKAAGGIAVGFDKAAAKAKLMEQELENAEAYIDPIFASSDILTAKDRAAGFTNNIFGMMSGGLLTNVVSGQDFKEDFKKGYYSIREALENDLAYAVTSGITNSNIGEAMRNMVSSIASAKANSYGSTLLGGLFSGNGFAGLGGAVSGFVGSIAISAIANNWKKWFGDKGKEETRASNAATIERGSNAYLQTYAAMLNPFMTNSMYSNLLDARYNSIGNMYVSWKSSSRGGLAGVFGGKNYRDTTPQSTFDVIQAMEDAVDAIKDYNKQEEKRLDLLNAQGYGYSVLSQQVNALSDAVDRANWMNDSYSINWTGGEHFEIDLSDNIQDLKKAYYEALREYGSETANRSNTASSTFLSLFPYLNDFIYGGTDSYITGYDIKNRSGLLKFFGSVRYDPIYGYQDYQTDISNPLSALNYVTNASNMFADRNANRQLFELISTSGANQFNMQSLQYSDPLAYTEQYLTVLERSRDAAELVMERQKQIYFDASKTFEEQSAALEMYQQAQDQYYNSKLEILAQEQAKEEQIRKEEQQAALRSSERMEALLGFTGEIARTGNKVYILEGADQVGALKEMIKNYGNDPEALAALQSMLAAAQNKSKFGKIA